MKKVAIELWLLLEHGMKVVEMVLKKLCRIVTK